MAVGCYTSVIWARQFIGRLSRCLKLYPIIDEVSVVLYIAISFLGTGMDAMLHKNESSAEHDQPRTLSFMGKLSATWSQLAAQPAEADLRGAGARRKRGEEGL